MNKATLIATVADRTGMTHKDTEAVLNCALNTITAALAADDRVQLSGFGVFEAKERKARTGRNPHTGEAVEIEATKVPAFKASKALKDAVAK